MRTMTIGPYSFRSTHALCCAFLAAAFVCTPGATHGAAVTNAFSVPRSISFSPKEARAYLASVKAAPAEDVAAADLEVSRNSRGRVFGVLNKAAHTAPSLAAAAEAKARFQAAKASDPVQLYAPLRVTDQFIARHAGLFGVTDPASELEAVAAEQDALGMTHVRYHQYLRGIPVLGGEVVAHVNAAGQFKTANGNAAPTPKVATEPDLPVEQAMETGLGLWKRRSDTQSEGHVVVTNLFVFSPSLFLSREAREFSEKLFDQRVAQNTMDSGPAPATNGPTWVDGDYLVWSVRVAGRAAEPDVSYLIDAHTGKPRWELSNKQYLNRRIYDCTNAENAWLLDQYVAAYNFTFGRSEGQPARGIDPISQSDDVDLAYDEMGAMQNYILNVFGRNGANGTGGIADDGADMVTVGANLNASFFGGFPGGAAYFTPPGDGRITYSKGWVEPSITGHEYCHAIQYFTHPPYGMIYQSQSGALMEGHSDVFGEGFRKYVNGSTSWIFEIPGMPGEVDNMANPNDISVYFNFPYADSLYSRTYYCGDTSYDYGGVHTDSRPMIKAAWLATVGGVYNNCTITALGMEKVAQIWYRAIFNYYSSAAQFTEAYSSLQQACSDLYPSGDCSQLVAALQAVEFDQPGRCDTSTGRRKAGCAPSACYDSDGADNGNVAGYVTYYTKTYIDFCANSKVVLENYCSTDVRRYKYVACTNGCLDGRCLP